MSNFNKYYNNHIQLSPNTLNDVLSVLNITTKLLVFGLGYDSNLWYYTADTYFVEDNQQYIDLNNHINTDHIIKYNYENITVAQSFHLTMEEIERYPIPAKLLELKPFDVILIDGPAGYNNSLPGRLLPIYWSAFKLSQPGTIIFIDDINRPLESYCKNKFLASYLSIYSKERDGFLKTII